ncbi:MAG: hypothetical protein DHS20C17_04400 [Cyclobacteriaceae bacterium]|nr:MAG: hypothetical protein DHS20C17_04400 [Cyclobacteriaceae bacterium]
MKLVGFQLIDIEPGRTFGALDLKPDHLQQTGLVHGGVTATLADIVCGFAAYTLVYPEQHVVTADLQISYLRPGLGTRLEAEGKVLKSGEKICFCESEVWAINQQSRELIAKARAVMAVVSSQKKV